MPRLEGTEVANDRNTDRPRMPLEERAKIFKPFDPLKGFREALAERERMARESIRDFEPFEDGTPVNQ